MVGRGGEALPRSGKIRIVVVMVVRIEDKTMMGVVMKVMRIEDKSSFISCMYHFWDSR